MRLLRTVGFLLILITQQAFAADLVVVVRADSDIAQLNRDDVINIFLGRYRQLPNGRYAEPVDLTPESALFYERLTGKTQAEINAYWARLLFTGRTNRPRIVSSAEKLLEALAQSPLAIGYLDRSRVDRKLKIVFEQDH